MMLNRADFQTKVISSQNQLWLDYMSWFSRATYFQYYLYQRLCALLSFVSPSVVFLQHIVSPPIIYVYFSVHFRSCETHAGWLSSSQQCFPDYYTFNLVVKSVRLSPRLYVCHPYMNMFIYSEVSVVLKWNKLLHISL